MDQRIIGIILGMAVVTYIPRYLPIMFLTKYELPDPIRRWLSYVPVAVLSALLAPGILLTKSGHIDLSTSNHYLLASIPCLIVAWKSKSMFLTIIVGMISIMLLSEFF